jgi:hypothetical protein
MSNPENNERQIMNTQSTTIEQTWKRERLGTFGTQHFLIDSPYWIESNSERRDYKLYGNIDGRPNVYIAVHGSLKHAKAHAERLVAAGAETKVTMNEAAPVAVSIFGPNICHGSEFHVHAPGCMDTIRDPKRCGYRDECPMEGSFSTEREVVEFVYSDQIREHRESCAYNGTPVESDQYASADGYIGEFKFFPCCGIKS